MGDQIFIGAAAIVLATGVLWMFGLLPKIGAWVYRKAAGRVSPGTSDTPTVNYASNPYLSVTGVPNTTHEYFQFEQFEITVQNSGNAAARLLEVHCEVVLVDDFGSGASYEVPTRLRNPATTTIPADESLVIEFSLKLKDWSVAQAGLVDLLLSTRVDYEKTDGTGPSRYEVEHKYSREKKAVAVISEKTGPLPI